MHTPTPSHIRAHGGFTILEGLLAGVILAVSAVAIAHGMNQSMEAARLAREHDEAAMLLDQVFTRIYTIGPDRLLSVGPREGRFPEPYENYRWEVTIQTTELPDLYRLGVRLSWPTPRGTRHVEADTQLYDPPGSRPTMLDWGDL